MKDIHSNAIAAERLSRDSVPFPENKAHAQSCSTLLIIQTHTLIGTQVYLQQTYAEQTYRFFGML